MQRLCKRVIVVQEWRVGRAVGSAHLHKSHFHNLLQICTQEGKMRNVNVFMLTDKDRKDSAVDGKKDVALYAVCGLQPLLP